MNELKHKKLSFFFDGPEQAMVYQNKVAMRLLLHNISSNMVHYAVENSELEISLDLVGDQVHLVFKNAAKEHHLQNILESNKSPFFVPRETQDYAYSSGNGVYLIKDLAKFLHGTCEYQIEDSYVVTRLIIPNEVQKNEK